MGNRLLLKAARQYDVEQAAQAQRKILGHVALAAPDVDAATFAALVPSAVHLADSVTLYYCQQDRALLASQVLHFNKPVGLGPFFAAGLETVNADLANTSILGHGYFAESHPLLLDLNLLLRYNRKPSERLPPLVPMAPVFGYTHWALKAWK
jgi:esterase/lipase superfamily enzyme